MTNEEALLLKEWDIVYTTFEVWDSELGCSMGNISLCVDKVTQDDSEVKVWAKGQFTYSPDGLTFDKPENCASFGEDFLERHPRILPFKKDLDNAIDVLNAEIENLIQEQTVRLVRARANQIHKRIPKLAEFVVVEGPMQKVENPGQYETVTRNTRKE